jgi:N-acyl-D-aspartate/D-glutamate deacylase
MLDAVIRNGSVVDGTGAPARRADVAVADGRIVAIGDVDDLAAEVIDAFDLVVAPGFVDLHTHYDPHVMWDPGVTPSSLHGVTTVVGGNCGFTLAPMTPAAAEYLVPMLARVEGMPVESLRECLELDWDSFGAWLAELDGNVAINAGFLVGHSTLRRIVMGEDAVGRPARHAEIEQMTSLLHRSLAEGALGFSSSQGAAHYDHNGDRVPSRWAGRDELVALSAAVADHPGTTLEFIPSSVQVFDDDTVETMTAMSRAARRPLNWNVLFVFAGEEQPARRESLLALSDHAERSGGMIRALTLPFAPRIRLNFLTGVAYDAIPGWSDLIFKLTPDARITALRDPAVRARLAQGAREHDMQHVTDWANCRIADVASPALMPLVGRRIGDIAAERGVEPFDALLDVVTEDGLLTGVDAPLEDNDELWRQRLALWRDGRTIIGASDAGAHLDVTDTFAMHTLFLAEAVRSRQLLSLEEAIWHITDVPARFYGITGRGRIADGWRADLVVLDPTTVGPGSIEFRADLPAGGRRLYSEPTGIEATLVNGVVTTRHGALTGATAGTVLRSGVDTETVAI